MPNIFNILTRETRCVCCYRVRPVGLLRRACADCRRNAQCGAVNCREVEDRFEDAEAMLPSEYAAWRKLRRMGLNLPAGNPRHREAAMRGALANLLMDAGYQGLALSTAYPEKRPNGFLATGAPGNAYTIAQRSCQPGARPDLCPGCAITMVATVDDLVSGRVGHICPQCQVIWLLSQTEWTVNELNREIAAAGYPLEFQLSGNGSLELKEGK